uniref:Retrovirus-related Pol polyprotein from transposon TNT 1-94 n=1 Tax=Tanacetum cinerariifolium TaxID=118510 RepID=A0A699H3K7_TANCI|nr:retrovirus-related Pol polyprotein from transposon TNT 1-94 [Tanacetum cinerariifolium]
MMMLCIPWDCGVMRFKMRIKSLVTAETLPFPISRHDVSYLQDTQPESTRKTLAFGEDFQDNSNKEVDERSSEEYLRELDDEEEVFDDEEVTQVKVLMALADDELTVIKSHAQNGYDQEMVPKNKDWPERLNPDIKLLNINTGRILVLESQTVNESLETLNTHESSKDYEAKFLTPLPLMKNLQGSSPSPEKYTLVIVDEYSRYTWVYFLRRKRQVHEMIMSFIRMEENHVPEVIVLNEHNVPLTEDIEDPLDLINTEGTHERNI